MKDPPDGTYQRIRVRAIWAVGLLFAIWAAFPTMRYWEILPDTVRWLGALPLLSVSLFLSVAIILSVLA